MQRHVLAIVAFVVATFIAQALSHFVVNAEHYATIPHIRKEPIFQLGVLAMLIQGGILSVLFSKVFDTYRTVKNAVGFSWLMGSFLISYIAFAEAAKYTLPSIPTWVGIEIAAGFVQFTIFGMLLGLVYRNR